MKGFQKWPRLCLPILLIAGTALGWIVVQQTDVTLSEAQMGPGAQMQGPPLKLPPKLLASPAPPPEMDIEAPQQGPRQRPTRESLLEKIRNMPGGKEMLEEARKRGARIGMGPVESESALSYLNPFRVKEAEAQGSFSLTLDPSNNWSSSSPYGNLTFYGAMVYSSIFTSSTPSMRLYPTASGWATTFGIQVVNPLARLYVYVDTDGWYIVNFEAKGTSGTSVSMKHYSGGTYSTVASWTYSGTTQSCPALLELSAGYHYFYWISPSSVYIYEANVYSL